MALHRHEYIRRGGIINGGWWWWALLSPDGVAPSRMVSVAASVNLPLHYKVWKHRLTRVVPEKRAVKRLWCWCGGIINGRIQR